MATRIICGWCARTTAAGRCTSCGRDAALPWAQRGVEPPTVSDEAGRPTLDEATVRAQYAAARDAVINAGHEPTVEAIAERLERSPRTVRDWRRRFDLR